MFENGDSFENWLEVVDKEISSQGSVNVSIFCTDGEWFPVYTFPNGRVDSPDEAYYDSFEDASFITAATHVLSAKTNRSIKLVGDLDINNTTENTSITLSITEDQH